MTDAETILIVEDEQQIREAVAMALGCEGFVVCEAGTARHAAVQAAARKPNLVILDLGLPDRDGLHFIRDFRAWSPTPILILSARSEESSKVDALDAGADDYLTKPFGIAELLARVRALLRRRQPGLPAGEATLQFGDYLVDCVNRVVTRA